MFPDTSLGEDEIRALIGRLAELDMGGWTRAEVERALAAIGWSIGTGTFGLSLVTSLPAEGTVSTGLHGSEDEVYKIGVEIAETRDRDERVAVFRAVRAIAEERFWPAAWLGGSGLNASGAWIRWRHPGATIELTADDHGVELALFSTDQVDRYEYLFINQAQSLDDLPHRWFAIGEDAGKSMNFFPGGHRAGDWKELETLLAGTLADLVDEASCFDGPVIVAIRPPDEDDARYAQLWIHEGTLHVEASNFVKSPDPAWAPALTELGWVPPEGESNWTRTFAGPGRDGAAEAARLLVGALRVFGLQLPGLRAHSSMRGTRWLCLPALGLG